jgi:hypothetical protein
MTADPSGDVVGDASWSTIKHRRWATVGGGCEICGAQLMLHEVKGHHIINQAFGGRDEEANCQVRCMRCESVMHSLFVHGNHQTPGDGLLLELYLGALSWWSHKEPIPASRLWQYMLDGCRSSNRCRDPEDRRIGRLMLRAEQNYCRDRVVMLSRRWSARSRRTGAAHKELEMLSRREQSRVRRGDEVGAQRFRRGQNTIALRLYSAHAG